MEPFDSSPKDVLENQMSQPSLTKLRLVESLGNFFSECDREGQNEFWQSKRALLRELRASLSRVNKDEVLSEKTLRGILSQQSRTMPFAENQVKNDAMAIIKEIHHALLKHGWQGTSAQPYQGVSQDEEHWRPGGRRMKRSDGRLFG